MFEVSATIPSPYFEEADSLKLSSALCFDTTLIVLRIMEKFPEALICLHDYAWKDYDHFKQLSLLESNRSLEECIRIAENDAYRTGPKYIFRLQTNNKQVIRGIAEKYSIRIFSETLIPEDLKQRFLDFLQTLIVVPSAEIKSVCIEGNDESPF